MKRKAKGMSEEEEKKYNSGKDEKEIKKRRE